MTQAANVWQWPLQGKEGAVKVIEDRRHFEVGLDATYFKDEDITVKVIDNQMEIMLEHEQRTSRFGVVKRTINRCYRLPEGVDPRTVRHHLYNNVLYIRGDKRWY
ncbi:unnamed protein product, partial [Mesorhabditis belari]|uniref:SHSP domain-containing protein n=1 Tax=Mesorhabditis belari TaxID=2138241 RepID=A0AAF3EIP2_9BILA